MPDTVGATQRSPGCRHQLETGRRIDIDGKSIDYLEALPPDSTLGDRRSGEQRRIHEDDLTIVSQKCSHP